MKCTNCGEELPNNAKFCRECGNEVIISERTETLTDKQCPECGNVLEEGTMFCNNCGHITSQDSSYSDYKFCPNCGKRLKSNVSFCGECGQLIDDVHGNTHKNIKNKKSMSKKDKGLIGLIIALIFVVVLSLSIITVVCLKNKSIDLSEPNVENASQRGEIDETETSDEFVEQENMETDDIEYGQPYFDNISASSELASTGKYSYYATKLIDGDKSTAWAESTSGCGNGQTIIFSSSKEQNVSGIKILNGYCKSNDLYLKNNRVKNIKISFSDGSSYIKTLDDEFMKFNEIRFNKIIKCNIVTLTIIDVYNGTDYDDTCISEIEFF